MIIILGKGKIMGQMWIVIHLCGKPRKDSDVYGPFATQAEAEAFLSIHEDQWADEGDSGVFPVQSPGAVCTGSRYGHTPIAGMMHVDSEDLATVAQVRRVTCEHCDHVYNWRTGTWSA